MMNSKILKFVALIPLGLMTLVLLLFGIGEMAGGDWSGAGHFIPVLFVVLVIALGWRRPLWGGGLFLVGAVLNSLRYLPAMLGRQNNTAPLFIMILPLALSGGLLLWAGFMERKATRDSAEHQPESKRDQ